MEWQRMLKMCTIENGNRKYWVNNEINQSSNNFKAINALSKKFPKLRNF